MSRGAAPGNARPPVTLPVLFRITLRPQSHIYPSASPQQYLLKGCSEIPVKSRINDRVQKTIGEPQPQENAEELVGDVG